MPRIQVLEVVDLDCMPDLRDRGPVYIALEAGVGADGDLELDAAATLCGPVHETGRVEDHADTVVQIHDQGAPSARAVLCVVRGEGERILVAQATLPLDKPRSGSGDVLDCTLSPLPGFESNARATLRVRILRDRASSSPSAEAGAPRRQSSVDSAAADLPPQSSTPTADGSGCDSDSISPADDGPCLLDLVVTVAPEHGVQEARWSDPFDDYGAQPSPVLPPSPLTPVVACPDDCFDHASQRGPPRRRKRTSGDQEPHARAIAARALGSLSAAPRSPRVLPVCANTGAEPAPSGVLGAPADVRTIFPRGRDPPTRLDWFCLPRGACFVSRWHAPLPPLFSLLFRRLDACPATPPDHPRDPLTTRAASLVVRLASLACGHAVARVGHDARVAPPALCHALAREACALLRGARAGLGADALGEACARHPPEDESAAAGGVEALAAALERQCAFPLHGFQGEGGSEGEVEGGAASALDADVAGWLLEEASADEVLTALSLLCVGAPQPLVPGGVCRAFLSSCATVPSVWPEETALQSPHSSEVGVGGQSGPGDEGAGAGVAPSSPADDGLAEGGAVSVGEVVVASDDDDDEGGDDSDGEGAGSGEEQASGDDGKAFRPAESAAEPQSEGTDTRHQSDASEAAGHSDDHAPAAGVDSATAKALGAVLQCLQLLPPLHRRALLRLMSSLRSLEAAGTAREQLRTRTRHLSALLLRRTPAAETVVAEVSGAASAEGGDDDASCVRFLLCAAQYLPAVVCALGEMDPASTAALAAAPWLQEVGAAPAGEEGASEGTAPVPVGRMPPLQEHAFVLRAGDRAVYGVCAVAHLPVTLPCADASVTLGGRPLDACGTPGEGARVLAPYCLCAVVPHPCVSATTRLLRLALARAATGGGGETAAALLGVSLATPAPLEGTAAVHVRAWRDALRFQVPPPGHFPPSGSPAAAVLRLLGVPLVLHVLGSLAQERRLLLISSSPNRLLAVAETLRTLLYPLPWPHVFVPLLPPHLGEYLHAPVPFLVGILDTSEAAATALDLPGLAVLHVDEARLEERDGPPLLPDEETASLTSALNDALQSGTDSDQGAGTLQLPWTAEPEVDARVRELMLLLWCRLLTGYRAHTFFINRHMPAFNREAYLRRACPPAVHDFASQLCDTQLFAAFLAAQHRRELNLFLATLDFVEAAPPGEHLYSTPLASTADGAVVDAGAAGEQPRDGGPASPGWVPPPPATLDILVEPEGEGEGEEGEVAQVQTGAPGPDAAPDARGFASLLLRVEARRRRSGGNSGLMRPLTLAASLHDQTSSKRPSTHVQSVPPADASRALRALLPTRKVVWGEAVPVPVREDAEAGRDGRTSGASHRNAAASAALSRRRSVGSRPRIEHTGPHSRRSLRSRSVRHSVAGTALRDGGQGARAHSPLAVDTTERHISFGPSTARGSATTWMPGGMGAVVGTHGIHLNAHVVAAVCQEWARGRDGGGASADHEQLRDPDDWYALPGTAAAAASGGIADAVRPMRAHSAAGLLTGTGESSGAVARTAAMPSPPQPQSQVVAGASPPPPTGAPNNALAHARSGAATPPGPGRSSSRGATQPSPSGPSPLRNRRGMEGTRVSTQSPDRESPSLQVPEPGDGAGELPMGGTLPSSQQQRPRRRRARRSSPLLLSPLHRSADRAADSSEAAAAEEAVDEEVGEAALEECMAQLLGDDDVAVSVLQACLHALRFARVRALFVLVLEQQPAVAGGRVSADPMRFLTQRAEALGRAARAGDSGARASAGSGSSGGGGGDGRGRGRTSSHGDAAWLFPGEPGAPQPLRRGVGGGRGGRCLSEAALHALCVLLRALLHYCAVHREFDAAHSALRASEHYYCHVRGSEAAPKVFAQSRISGQPLWSSLAFWEHAFCTSLSDALVAWRRDAARGKVGPQRGEDVEACLREVVFQRASSLANQMLGVGVAQASALAFVHRVATAHSLPDGQRETLGELVVKLAQAASFSRRESALEHSRGAAPRKAAGSRPASRGTVLGLLVGGDSTASPRPGLGATGSSTRGASFFSPPSSPSSLVSRGASFRALGGGGGNDGASLGSAGTTGRDSPQSGRRTPMQSLRRFLGLKKAAAATAEEGDAGNGSSSPTSRAARVRDSMRRRLSLTRGGTTAPRSAIPAGAAAARTGSGLEVWRPLDDFVVHRGRALRRRLRSPKPQSKSPHGGAAAGFEVEDTASVGSGSPRAGAGGGAEEEEVMEGMPSPSSSSADHAETDRGDGTGRVDAGRERAEYLVVQASEESMVCLSHHGHRFVGGGCDAKARVWHEGAVRLGVSSPLYALEGHARPISCACMHGNTVVTGSHDQSLRVWTLPAAEEEDAVLEVEAVPRAPWDSAEPGEDDDYLLVRAGEATDVASAVELSRRLRAAQSGDEGAARSKLRAVRTLEGHTASVLCVAPLSLHGSGYESSPRRDSDWSLVGDWGRLVPGPGAGGTVGGVLAEGEAPEGPNATGSAPVSQLPMPVLAKDGHTSIGALVSGSHDADLRVWNAGSGACLATLQGHASPVTCIATHPTVTVAPQAEAELPTGARVVSGARDSTVKVWDVGAQQEVCSLLGHRGWLRRVHMDGPHVVFSAAHDGVRLWDVRARKCVATLSGHESVVRALDTDGPGAATLVTGGDDTVCVWDLRASATMPRLRLRGHARSVIQVQCDWVKVVSAGEGGSVAVHELVHGTPVANLQPHSDNAVALAVTDDTVVTASWDHTLSITRVLSKLIT